MENGECISTTDPVGYTIHRLNASSLMQDISFFPWADAEKYELSAATYYVKMGQQSTVVDALSQLGYDVTVNPTAYISGKFSVLLFGFVPAFMLVASMAFYILSSGKKNVLKKMEGYAVRDILADEVANIFPIFAASFLIIEAVTLIAAATLYQTALPQYILFSLPNILGIPRRQVYEILKNSKYSHFFETIVIAEKKRITKESFQKFLDGQDHYKLDPANDYEELSMEQNFSLANYRRKKLAKTGDRSKNGNLGYLTFDEAAFLAKVSRGMIYKWIDDGKFSSVKIGYISRVKRDEFEAWLKERKRKGN